MEDATIQSILLNGTEQPVDEQGNVDLSFDVTVEEDELNEGFSVTLGTEKKKLATTGEIKIKDDARIDIEDSFQEDNAIVLSKTLKQFAEVQNEALDVISDAVSSVSSKADIVREGYGVEQEACFTIIDTECRKGLKTYGILDLLEEKGYLPSLALTPEFIDRGYGIESDSNRYDMLSLEDILECKEKGYSFINGSWSQDKAIYDNYRATEADLRADFNKVNQWFAENGMKSCAFHYPYDTNETVKQVLLYYENYAIGDLASYCNYATPSYDISVVPLSIETFPAVNEAINKAVRDGGFVIFELKGFGQDKDKAQIQKNMLNTLFDIDIDSRIKYESLPDILKHKGIVSFGDESSFFIQRDGVIRATMDHKTEVDITRRLEFDNISADFKKALFDYYKSEITANTPCLYWHYL